MAEAGVPGYAAPTWSGVIAPAGVPRPIIDKLNAAINRAIASQTFRDRFASIGDEPAGGTPEDFAEVIRSDSAKWARRDPARGGAAGLEAQRPGPRGDGFTYVWRMQPL